MIVEVNKNVLKEKKTSFCFFRQSFKNEIEIMLNESQYEVGYRYKVKVLAEGQASLSN